jgi:Ca2+-binding RTX toxin-like protein
MNEMSIMSGVPIETSDDPKHKSSLLSSPFDNFDALFQIPFLDRKNAQTAQQERRNVVPLPNAIRIQDANSASAPITEKNKPWMAKVFSKNITGFAGDYGLQQVWNEGIRGQGVKVGVNDSGLVRGHADFDYTELEDNEFLFFKKKRQVEHGTNVAGFIAAQANGVGVVGVANKSTLWLCDDIEVDDKDSFVLEAIVAGCDVVNNSWGPKAIVTNFTKQAGFNRKFDMAGQGRKGLGLNLVFCTGNERKFQWDTALQYTTNHENVIAVAAVDIHTQVTPFSTPGEAVHISALGENVILVNTFDLTGRSVVKGSGSSYSAPFVSGVVALMYQANPGLGLRDVQAILAHSARLPKSGMAGFSFNGGMHANGGGLHFSRDYGFGLVNAHAAVRLAQSWFAGGVQAETGLNRQFTKISAHKRSGTRQNYTLKFSPSEAGDIEHVKLRLDLDTKDINDLRVVLVSPRGTESVLMDDFGQPGVSINQEIDLGSRRFWGEDAAGEWSVKISSRRSLNMLRGATLILSSDADTHDDRYVYTDEFNALADADPLRRLLEDSDGGNDTFNAASLTGSAVIDLHAGIFRFGQGPEGRITGKTVIETVVGGDGNDFIVGGDDVGNKLYGGNGNDTLDGGVGVDTLVGGRGDDYYRLDDAGDVVIEGAGEGNDLVESRRSCVLGANLEDLLLAGTENISGTGNVLDNVISGNNGDNNIDGGAGKDTLVGGGGNDIILFNKGDGQDTVYSRGGGRKTLSLGGDFSYSDLALSKSGRDLVLKMGSGDQICFLDWYGAKPSRPIVNLQVMTEAMRDFNAGSSDPLRDQKVEQFDFAGLVGAFDAERITTPTRMSWALSNALLKFQGNGSDSAAIGGDLAYQYGRRGMLAGIGLCAAQDVIGDSGFGMQLQALRSFSELQSGSVILS